MKSNYGPAGEKVKLRWEDGCFVTGSQRQRTAPGRRAPECRSPLPRMSRRVYRPRSQRLRNAGQGIRAESLCRDASGDWHHMAAPSAPPRSGSSTPARSRTCRSARHPAASKGSRAESPSNRPPAARHDHREGPTTPLLPTYYPGAIPLPIPLRSPCYPAALRLLLIPSYPPAGRSPAFGLDGLAWLDPQEREGKNSKAGNHPQQGREGRNSTSSRPHAC